MMISAFGFIYLRTYDNVYMESVFSENSINLDYDVEPDLTSYGSSEQIKQLAMILLDNTIKYTDGYAKVVYSNFLILRNPDFTCK